MRVLLLSLFLTGCATRYEVVEKIVGAQKSFVCQEKTTFGEKDLFASKLKGEAVRFCDKAAGK